MKRFVIKGQLLTAVLGVLALAIPSSGWAADREQTTAELLLGAEVARAGSSVLAGIRLDMPEGWHTYWRNPGDSGAPTEIEWDLPNGISAGPIQWPLPEKYEQNGLTTYVYHDEVVLIVPLQLGAELEPGEYRIQADVSWLECEKQCLPGSAEVEDTLSVDAAARQADALEILSQWQARAPRPDPGIQAEARWKGAADRTDQGRPLLIKAVPLNGSQATDFFPYQAEAFSVSPATRRVAGADGVFLQKTVKASTGEWPGEIHGVLVAGAAGDDGRDAVETVLEPSLAGDSPDEPAEDGPVAATGPDAAPGVSPPAGPQGAGSGEAASGLVKMLAFAFVGGLILNIMPCVLPIISLKIFGFVKQAGEQPRRIRQLGLVYSLGVLACFLALAGLVIGVQQAGQAAGWGMQFASPYFLVFMTVLMTLVALNLFGVFEIYLAGRPMQAASAAASGEGFSGAFFSGVLATILATPCTAPFLGAALGFAFAQPPALIILMFLTIGLGLASPYLLLSCKPRWLQALPKPGPWMERFKVFMGFPMLGTAVWLLSLLITHYGASGLFWIGLFLVIVALAAWMWGTFVQRARHYRALGIASSLAVLVLGYWLTMESQLNWRAQAAGSNAGAGLPGPQSRAGQQARIDWQEWSPEKVEEARRNGHTVLVDFTADWCITCQVNKKTSLEIESTRQKLKEVNGVAFKADYTMAPPRMTRVLQEYGRAGVPLVLIYPPDPDAEALVLPEVLHPSLVHRKLEEAARAGKSTAAVTQSRG